MMRNQKFSMDIGWKILLNDLGVDSVAILRRARLPEDFFQRKDQGLTTEEYFRFWLGIEQEVNNPLFPLMIVDLVSPETFNPPIFAALCSSNLMQAVQRLAKYKQMMAPLSLDIDVASNGDMTLTPRWLQACTEVPSSLAYAEIAFFIRLARMGTRDNVIASKVTLPKFQHPQCLRHFENFFGVTPSQGSTASITFSGVDALRPFLTSNEAMWRAFEPDLQKRLSEISTDSSTSERVKSLLLELLPSNNATMDTVSERLALSKRTLQRKLNDEGGSFRALLSETRESLAKHYLMNTAMSGAEIAFLLGFEDPNSFYRAFQAWTGVSPEVLRGSKN